MRILDWIMATITLVLGFFLGLVAVQILMLLQMGAWIIALVFVVGFGLIYLFLELSDRLFGSLVKKAAPDPNETTAPKASKRISWYAFAIGLALAFLATRFWTVEQITALY